MRSAKKIANRFSYLLLLAVYGAFFFVQFNFFNFDTPGNIHLHTYSSFEQDQESDNIQTGIQQTQTAGVKKVRIPLHKGFHPKFAPGYTAIVNPVPAGSFQEPGKDHYTGPFSFMFSMRTHLQRGPPVHT